MKFYNDFAKIMSEAIYKDQKYSRVLHTFVANKPFGSLLEISPKNHIF